MEWSSSRLPATYSYQLTTLREHENCFRREGRQRQDHPVLPVHPPSRGHRSTGDRRRCRHQPAPGAGARPGREPGGRAARPGRAVAADQGVSARHESADRLGRGDDQDHSAGRGFAAAAGARGQPGLRGLRTGGGTRRRHRPSDGHRPLHGRRPGGRLLPLQDGSGGALPEPPRGRAGRVRRGGHDGGLRLLRLRHVHPLRHHVRRRRADPEGDLGLSPVQGVRPRLRCGPEGRRQQGAGPGRPRLPPRRSRGRPAGDGRALRLGACPGEGPTAPVRAPGGRQPPRPAPAADGRRRDVRAA